MGAPGVLAERLEERSMNAMPYHIKMVSICYSLRVSSRGLRSRPDGL